MRQQTAFTEILTATFQAQWNDLSSPRSVSTAYDIKRSIPTNPSRDVIAASCSCNYVGFRHLAFVMTDEDAIFAVPGRRSGNALP